MPSSSKKLVYNEVKEISFLDELIQWSKNKSLYYWIIIICSWLSIGLAFYHLFDMTYFDGRISITGWVMFAAIKNILTENHDRFKLKENKKLF